LEKTEEDYYFAADSLILHLPVQASNFIDLKLKEAAEEGDGLGNKC
jgi:hypothetical protein